MARDLKHFLLDTSFSVLQAMAFIDTHGNRVAYLVDENGRLLAAVTDGDIRRAILRGVPLDAPVTEAAHNRPITLPTGAAQQTIREALLNGSVMSIPLVDENGVVVDVVLLNDLLGIQREANPVVVMAGGLGSRLGSLTQNTPKPMLKVAGLPILHHILNNVKSAGYYDIYISVNYKAEMIEEYFKDGAAFGLNIRYVRESKRLGTGGGIKLCADGLKNDFFVINGDLLTNLDLKAMMKHHTASGFDMTIATRAYDVQLPYGVMEEGGGGRILGIKEKPKLSFMINAGVYCLHPRMLERIPDDTYFEITELVQDNATVGGYEIRDYWMDVGQIDDYYRADAEYRPSAPQA